MFYHASRSLQYRTPFGAQPVDSTVVVRFDADSSVKDVTLCYSYGLYDFNYHEEPMAAVSTENDTVTYETRLMLPHEPGLVFYWFRFCEAYGETKYYVMESDTEDASGKIYHEPPRIAANEDKYPYAWQITVYAKDFKTPDYMKGSLIYQIFPDRFARDKNFTVDRMMSCSDREERVYHEDWNEEVDIKGKPSTGYLACDFFGGSLTGIKERLDYIKSLGIDIIYLNPIFEARSSHRYDTADYLHVDPMLGGNDAFETFKNACNEKGIKLILDGVFSHTGADSRYFNKFGRYEGTGAYKAYENGEANDFRSWYNFYRDDEGKIDYDSWWGFPDLPNVDENNLKYREFIFGENGVVDTWCKRGASGLRLDVSDELPDSFIRQMRDTIKSKTNGEGMLVGEVWEDASNKCSYGSYRDFMLGRTHDSVMGYTFRTTMLEFLQGYISAKVFNSRMEGFRERYPAESYYCIMNLLSSHDVPRVYTMMSKPEDTGDKELQMQIKVSDEQKDICQALCRIGYAIQIAYVGAPCVYYGDEVLMEGYKDPFNRRTYPWDKVSEDGQKHLDYVRDISQLRVNNQVLRTGYYRTLYTSDDVIVFERYLENGKDYFEKDATGSKRIVLIVNRGEEPVGFELNAGKSITVSEAKVKATASYVVTGKDNGKTKVGVEPMSVKFVVYGE